MQKLHSSASQGQFFTFLGKIELVSKLNTDCRRVCKMHLRRHGNLAKTTYLRLFMAQRYIYTVLVQAEEPTAYRSKSNVSLWFMGTKCIQNANLKIGPCGHEFIWLLVNKYKKKFWIVFQISNKSYMKLRDLKSQMRQTEKCLQIWEFQLK